MKQVKESPWTDWSIHISITTSISITIPKHSHNRSLIKAWDLNLQVWKMIEVRGICWSSYDEPCSIESDPCSCALQTLSTHGRSPLARLKHHDGRKSPMLVSVRHPSRTFSFMHYNPFDPWSMSHLAWIQCHEGRESPVMVLYGILFLLTLTGDL